MKKCEKDNSSWLETHYLDGVSQLMKNLSLENAAGKTETATLEFTDGRELILILREFKDDVWVDNYKNVYLMNDKGETIERLV